MKMVIVNGKLTKSAVGEKRIKPHCKCNNL